jgi:phosphonoacetaldehyde hydrolase
MHNWDETTKITGVIFDWSGTILDFGAMAPIRAYMKSFEECGVPVTEDEARNSLELTRYDHIRNMLGTRRISREWERTWGKAWDQDDVEKIYMSLDKNFEASLKETAQIKPGILYITRQLREAGIKVGTTTEYNNQMLHILLPIAEQQGFTADCSLTSDAAMGKGRPYPYMIFLNMIKLGLMNVHQIIKVGDTVEDIKEGQAAGAWTVGILDGSAVMGLDEAHYNALSKSELSKYRQRALEVYAEVGADFAIRNVTELVDVIRKIEGK